MPRTSLLQPHILLQPSDTKKQPPRKSNSPPPKPRGQLADAAPAPFKFPSRQNQHLYTVPPPPPRRQSLHHRRKSSLKGVVPAWTEVEAGWEDLRDRSLVLGAELGELGGKLGGKLESSVPGLKESVAFLAILRTNLHLSSSLCPPSPFLRPITPPPYSQISTLNMSNDPSNAPADTGAGEPDLTDLPPLSYGPAEDEKTKIACLRLIADSVAQMRQTTGSLLIWSPLLVSAVLVLLAAAHHLLYRTSDDFAIMATTCSGILATYLLFTRLLASGYVAQAEGIGWRWLGTDELLYATYGDTIIGAVAWGVRDAAEVASLESAGGASGGGAGAGAGAGGGSGNKKKKGGEKVGLVRAWTVRKRERGNGVGRGLLEQVAERALRERGCANVVFADERLGRAGAKRELPSLLEGLTGVSAQLLRREQRAERTLAAVVREEREKKRKR